MAQQAGTTQRKADAASGNGRGAASERNGRRSGERPAMESIFADVALGPGQRFLPGLAGVRFAAKLGRRPQLPIRQGLRLGAELARIALGRSELEPDKSDRRFKDPAWKANPAFKRLCQAYLAAGDAVDGAISGADLDWRSERRVRFAAMNVLDALAPTNFAATNPSVLK